MLQDQERKRDDSNKDLGYLEFVCVFVRPDLFGTHYDH